MSANRSTVRVFRPGLERLERREVLSGLGLALSVLPPPVKATVNDMKGLVNKLQNDQQTLTNDVNAGATSQTIAADYSRASSDFGQIKADNGTVFRVSLADEAFISLAFLSGSLGAPTDSLAAYLAANKFNVLLRKSDSLLSSANGIANRGEPGGFPTIASQS
jgi:hypothetical protein